MDNYFANAAFGINAASLDIPAETIEEIVDDALSLAAGEIPDRWFNGDKLHDRYRFALGEIDVANAEEMIVENAQLIMRRLHGDTMRTALAARGVALTLMAAPSFIVVDDEVVDICHSLDPGDLIFGFGLGATDEVLKLAKAGQICDSFIAAAETYLWVTGG
jgi:hypothetical protein